MDFPVPSTTGYEHKLLATIIQDNSLATDIMSIVKREMFSNEYTQKIWDVFVDMYYKREKIDLLTIVPKVDNKYFFDNVLPTEIEYSVSGTMQLALSFLDTYIKRKAYFSAVDILQKINAGETSDSIREQFDRFSTKVTEGLGDKIADDAESIANEIADDIEKGNRTRVSTHIRTLDYYTYGGFGGGNLVILAARPSVGKTTIAMQIAQAASADLNRTLVFSLEMTKQELVQRLIQSTGLISQYQFCTNTIDWENYEKAISQVINGNLLINDEAYNINEIRQKIVIACQTQKIKMVMIDYLQLIKGANPRLSKADQVGEVTSILKQTAKQCNIPILVLAQLNRASASENRSPQLYDLRDSGSIEQDADIVIMLERPRNELGNIADNKIDMWIRKNRQGRCNFDSPISLKGNEYYTNFVEESLWQQA
mgnify:FL=1